VVYIPTPNVKSIRQHMQLVERELKRFTDADRRLNQLYIHTGLEFILFCFM
jgi:hypothetical protein